MQNYIPEEPKDKVTPILVTLIVIFCLFEVIAKIFHWNH